MIIDATNEEMIVYIIQVLEEELNDRDTGLTGTLEDLLNDLRSHLAKGK